MNEYFEDVELVSLETNSGVSETPIGDEEGIKGCFNRIQDSLKQDNTGDLYVAMEGILTETTYGTFLCGWTVIFDTEYNEYYYGCSAKIKIPDNIVKQMNKTQRLSDIVAKNVGSTDDEISILGTNGLLTNGSYTRTDEFTDSIVCAISTKYRKNAVS